MGRTSGSTRGGRGRTGNRGRGGDAGRGRGRGRRKSTPSGTKRAAPVREDDPRSSDDDSNSDDDRDDGPASVHLERSDLIYSTSVPVVPGGRKKKGRNNANKKATREFYRSVGIPPRTDLIARGARHLSPESSKRSWKKETKKKRRQSSSSSADNGTERQQRQRRLLWTVSIGDAACLESYGSSTPNSATRRENRRWIGPARVWFPFVVDWSPCQVVSIYRDVDGGGARRAGGGGGDAADDGGAGGVMVEVRRLYRHSDLQAGTVPGLSGGGSALSSSSASSARGGGRSSGSGRGLPVEEVLETYRVSDGIDATSLIGRVRLVDDAGRPFGGPFRSSGGGSSRDDDDDAAIPVPTVDLLCHRFYASSEEQVMPIVRASERWVERAVPYSEMVANHGGLGLALRRKLGLSLHDEDSATTILEQETVAAPVRIPPPIHSSRPSPPAQARCYFDSIYLPVLWTNYQYGNVICDPEKRRGCATDLRWMARLGDVVAVQSDEALPPSLKEAVLDKEGNPWYPYALGKGWRPCRVVSIYMDAESEDSGKRNPREAPNAAWRNVADGRSVKVEVQMLYRLSDLEAAGDIPVPRDARKNDSSTVDIELFEMDRTMEIGCEDLLGPITTDSPISAGEMRFDESNWLPPVFNECHRCFDSDRCRMVEMSSSRKDAVRRLITVSKNYRENKELGEVVSTLLEKGRFSRDAASHRPFEAKPSELEGADDSDGRADPNKSDFEESDIEEQSEIANDSDDRADPNKSDFDESDIEEQGEEQGEIANDRSVDEEEDTTVWTSKTPYHVDVSSSKSFYTEVHVSPPFDHYASQFQTFGNAKMDTKWEVRLGDTVAVHYQVGGNADTGQEYPFGVTWSPAEVVCISKTHGSTDRLLEMKEQLATDETAKATVSSKKKKKQKCSEITEPGVSPDDQISIEIRWLYRKSDIPGAGRKAISFDRTGGLEELVETDDLMECPATALLAPVKLHPSSVSCVVPTINDIGMPIMSYQCHRFWSVHRKSLMPTGSDKSRVSRGRMYSSYFGKDALLKAALDRALGVSRTVTSFDPSNGQENDVKISFRDAVSRLSLSDASADAQLRGLELTGRENELNQIRSFLRSAIRGGRESEDDEKIESSVKASMFIAGPPGTGKTACVRAVIAQLRHEQARGDLPSFDFVSLNGMEMQYPFDAYVRLWEAVSTGKDKRAPGVAAAMLERHFAGGRPTTTVPFDQTNNRRPVTVLLLDEIDYLVTRKQSVLYNFFEWPRRSATTGAGARLVVVGISNTINLPERLKPSVQSRLGRERCIFKAYNVEETCNILKARLEGGEDTMSVSSVFDQDAITFASRKTAVLSGDIRKAFQMCKVAAEAVLSELEGGTRSSAENRGGPVVRIADVQKASREMFNSIINKAVASATSFEALVIVCLASLQKHTGREKGGFDVQELMTKMQGTAKSTGDSQYLPAPTFGELLGILNRLGEARVITLQTPRGLHSSYHAALGGGGGAWPLITLRMEDYEVEAALRDTPHGTLVEKHLARDSLFLDL